MRPAAAAALVAALAVLVGAGPAHAAAPFTPWCGTDAASADRQPDAVSAFQIHVVYAIPSDGTDRLAERASAIATDAASMDAWWRAQDSGRALRFDVHAFPGCASALGALDLTLARLPHDSGHFLGLSGRFDRIRGDLVAPPFDLGDPDKKYLVYYDGPAESTGDGSTVCGQSNTGLTGGGPNAYAIVYLAGPCEQGLGAGSTATVAAIHELIHGLNALPFPGPPNACPGDRGHPCDNAQDILAPSQRAGVLLDTLVLDAGRDDYYGHSGAWWDIQDSPFLARLDSPDTSPPATPGGLTATSRDSLVTVSWQAATDDVGPVTYRVYRDGELVTTTSRLEFRETAAEGGTVEYAVRAADTVGFLSPRPAIRFTVGLGLVDAAGALVRDTVPPSAIASLRARLASRSLVLSWTAARDPGGLNGYLVERNGKRYAVVRKTSVTVPAAKARARWSVRAVDRAGNAGPPISLAVR